MKIGFIGAGNMGSAIIGGIVEKIKNAEIIVSDNSESARKAICQKFGAVEAKTNKDAANSSEILFLAVKPNVLDAVISEIKDFVSAETLIISIVAGKSIEYMENAFGKDIKLIRVMPNTPALVGEGMSALCKNQNVSDLDLENALEIFNSLGRAEVVAENIMDAVTAVSGSAPAYIFMLIEAMADGAVAGGMARNQAYNFAAQTVLGSAKMVLETGKHPAELKDMVCSPGGTTIDAVKVLEEKGFRCAVIDAMKACMDKSKKL
ncbi:MAG: pyrroline-5-carboxylate reductase [Clostridia bacterium]|nr:pyrroline-5-carboxylate reductase [Clostridia bacterium]